MKKKKKNRYIKRRDELILWSRAAGLCSICQRPLIKDFNKTGIVKVGERAHIIPFGNNNGRVSKKNQADNSYENLILLCENHHKIIDNAPLDFSKEKLLRIKKEHEDYVLSLSSKDTSIKKESCTDKYNILNQNIELFIGSEMHRYYRFIPRKIKQFMGLYNFGFLSVDVIINNPAKNKLNNICIKILPKYDSFPNNISFSLHRMTNVKIYPSSFCKTINIGPINSEDYHIDYSSFYINYIDSNYKILRKKLNTLEFEYIITCDNYNSTKGNLKFENIN